MLVKEVTEKKFIADLNVKFGIVNFVTVDTNYVSDIYVGDEFLGTLQLTNGKLFAHLKTKNRQKKLDNTFVYDKFYIDTYHKGTKYLDDIYNEIISFDFKSIPKQ